MAKKTVLIVDDDKLIRTMLRHYCTQSDFEVIEAENGQEALQRINAERPDLVIMDVMMPGINGLHVARRIRKSFDKNQLPILFLTSESDSQTRYEAIAAGAQVFLTKPISLGDLLKSIRQLTADQPG
ncbi:MAG: response regulator transcription factor [Anaerolineales bacterium]|nr:response regulator transcription factor [Anaerolineales bacterium]